MLSAGVTKVSKNRQVRRAVRRSAPASAADIVSRPRRGATGWSGRQMPGTPSRAPRTAAPAAMFHGPRPDRNHQRQSRDDDARRPSGDRSRQGSDCGPTAACAAVRPFQQMTAGDEQADQRAHDGVAHRPGLMRQQNDQQPGLRQRQRRSTPNAPTWLRSVIPAWRGTIASTDRNKVGSTMVARMKAVQMTAASGGRLQPSQRAPATADGADSVRRRLSSIFHRPDRRDSRRACRRSSGRHAENPWQQLPVAARPAVVARRRDIVAGRKFLDDLDIRGETGAGEHALEQIMAEQRRVRHAACQRRLEGIDIVDALAGIGAFAEQILIHVGYGRRIGIDAVHAGEDALEQRAFAPDRQRRRHPRLQHRVALDDPARTASKRGRLSGWAILPISRRTVSRGSRVSASRVMT